VDSAWARKIYIFLELSTLNCYHKTQFRFT